MPDAVLISRAAGQVVAPVASIVHDAGKTGNPGLRVAASLHLRTLAEHPRIDVLETASRLSVIASKQKSSDGPAG
jgi:hypothetical protein